MGNAELVRLFFVQIFEFLSPLRHHRCSICTKKRDINDFLIVFQQVSEGEPAVIWLSGLHIPESYLTALVQAACRKNGWPLDRSTLYTTVTAHTDPKSIAERPPTGCYVTGLYLEGASWDLEKSALTKPRPKQLICDLPILRVIPTEAHKLKLKVSWRSAYLLFRLVST